MKDRYFFPAIFTISPDGISVEFPDLPGCLTAGKTEEEAFRMAREALALHLFGMEQDWEPIPEPSKASSLKPAENQFVAVIEAWMPLVRDRASQRLVKKTLTIPEWLNELAEQQGINFSQLLQQALKQRLGLDGRP